ncbi:hypothetical protein ATY81_24400 [Rhizobium sp. R72]|nr:hypothetical protein ATY79_28150 [Rhizobium sp. R693]OWW01504.1 hypothetical protein ATY81_24400 [Rhizobium sp. R72]OWW01592.1 hypothetical protein ATY80_24400 [Rhizobium sp. R711]
MQFPTFTLENGEVEVLTSVIQAWCQANQIDPESECARAVIVTALDLIEAGFRTRESLSIALANALAPDAFNISGE